MEPQRLAPQEIPDGGELVGGAFPLAGRHQLHAGLRENIVPVEVDVQVEVRVDL